MKGLLSNIVTVVNGAESSIAAAKLAIALKKQYGSRVIAVYVVDTATIRSLAMSRIFVPDESEEYERSLEDTGNRYLAFISDLAKAKRLNIDTKLLKGSVADEISKVAEEEGADCIVLGGWGGDAVHRDMVIEANREIIAAAKCPVLVVKGPQAEQVYRAL
ncbi:MAG: universal stress protein [Spirochaetes bacterium]|nr:universal stress protein [Spirochaetota bacterium]